MSNFDAHIFGPVFSASGVGESARAYWRTLTATGLKVGVFPQSHPYNKEERVLSESFRNYMVNEPHPKLNFCRINAQEIKSLPGSFLQKKSKTRTDVLIPMWETPKLPTLWKDDILKFDHVIAATSFIKSSIESTIKDFPITIVPHAITIQEDFRITSRGLGLLDDRKYHLYSFAYSSFTTRKNPIQFLELKKLYCSKNDFNKDVFVLASSDLPRHKADIILHNSLLAEQDSNFVYLPGGRDRNTHLSLIANANSFVSVHRSEGIGLQLVEALSLGTKIITHNFSGPSDFIHATDPGVYKFNLVEIGNEEYPHSSGQHWAKLSTKEIFRAMSDNVDNSLAHLDMRRRVLDFFSMTNTSKMANRLLNEIT
jgi:glycosyltransferase involved in cell wall biosynthesis